MVHKLLKHGIRDGKIIHISDAERGLKCNCQCPCCKAILVAKKGETGKQQEHFAHYKSEQCEYAYETSLHYSAKALLERECSITLPYREKRFIFHRLSDLFQPKPGTNNIGNIISKTYNLKNIKSEKRLHNIVPDIQAQIAGRDILIEVAVTNKVKEAKFEKIKKIGIPTIEIDLSGLDYNFQERDLELNLFHNIRNKKWVFNPKDDELKEELIWQKNEINKQVMKLAIPLMKKGSKANTSISNCPKITNSKYKNVDLFECRNCPFFLSEFDYNILCGQKNYTEIITIINEKNEELESSL
ncbi:MAG: hypothetical protein WAQ28_13585 [Bacteroidia bacterium]|jgi:hypothetical protein